MREPNLNEAGYGEDDARLQQTFERYRAACPDVEPSAKFMPNLWARIEARHSFSFAFWRLGRSMAAASAVLCLLLVVLNLIAKPSLPASYTDALISDYSAEQTYYTEAIRSTPPAADTTLTPR